MGTRRLIIKIIFNINTYQMDLFKTLGDAFRPEPDPEYPEDVALILGTYDYDRDGYKECKRIISELEDIGWTADFGLSAELYDIKKQ